MNLGAFSVSLAVKNINESKEFYEKLGFTVFGGDISQKWLIMKNGQTIIGLFEGMFTENILTFNPGWTQNAETLASYTDVREIQKVLKLEGVEILNEVDESGRGPGSFSIIDPDGNAILIDQHV
ncbi:MAG: VOC family protein [Melioribacteraceae bacterium]|nr:VOC family protein [Melioribacteraceae bacterium]MCF8263587.1 VOC family protein [Melioribacteraceae bacterium]MCF8412420.1 VOC family protein [Melioribacteraceae bacterium]MCF8432192.1 VOC family protein [Melioribacteraceae bacterium]